MTPSRSQIIILGMFAVVTARLAVAQAPAPQPIGAKLERAITEYTRALQLAASPQERRELEHALRALRRLAVPRSIDASRRLGCSEPGVFLVPLTWKIEDDTIVTCSKVMFPDSAKVKILRGKALLIDSEQIVVGKSVDVDGTGETGRKPDPPPPIEREWISGSDAAYWAALNDCRSRPDHPDRGRRGGDGGEGGSGGHLVITVPTQQPLAPRLDGGKGGPGGDGGRGRLLKNSRNYYCDGCTMHCPSNGSGNQGKDGIAGRFILLD